MGSKKLKTFSVCAVVVGSKYIGEFRAASEAEALEMAWKEAGVSLCHRCSSECESAEIEELRAEEVDP